MMVICNTCSIRKKNAMKRSIWAVGKAWSTLGCVIRKGIFFFKLINLFIYFWLCWVLVSVRGLSLVVASGGYASSRCMGLSLSRPLLLRSTGSRRAGSVVVAQGPSCSTACGIFPDQGSNPCPLHWQADCLPLHHQGSPGKAFWKGWCCRWDLKEKDQLYGGREEKSKKGEQNVWRCWVPREWNIQENEHRSVWLEYDEGEKEAMKEAKTNIWFLFTVILLPL